MKCRVEPGEINITSAVRRGPNSHHTEHRGVRYHHLPQFFIDACVHHMTSTCDSGKPLQTSFLAKNKQKCRSFRFLCTLIILKATF
ncbi:hypothetical protein C0J52_13220 [Blattella germanica]|nr:hypothetical protein C0J52_13220 [Blattella germanica]